MVLSFVVFWYPLFILTIVDVFVKAEVSIIFTLGDGHQGDILTHFYLIVHSSIPQLITLMNILAYRSPDKIDATCSV